MAADIDGLPEQLASVWEQELKHPLPEIKDIRRADLMSSCMNRNANGLRIGRSEMSFDFSILEAIMNGTFFLQNGHETTVVPEMMKFGGILYGLVA